MAKMKTVGIEAKLGERFKTEVKAGTHTLYVDQPTTGGGSDTGPTPLEYFFISLAGCIAATARIMAIQKRIKLNGMDIKIEGEFDQEVILGKSKENRPGFSGIRVQLSLDAPDMSKEDKEKYLHEIETRCPVSDNIACTTPITIEVL